MVADLKTEPSDGFTMMFGIQRVSFHTTWSQFLGTSQAFFCCWEISLCTKQQLKKNMSNCFTSFPPALLVYLLKVILNKSSQIFAQQSPFKTFSSGTKNCWTCLLPLGWLLMHFQGRMLSLLSCTEWQQALTASLAQRNLNEMAPALGSTRPLKMDRSIYKNTCTSGCSPLLRGEVEQHRMGE